MSEGQIDLNENVLEKKDELKIIYDGPSFNGQMEISNLSKQLSATEFLIKEIVGEYYKQRGFQEKPEVQIYLKLHKGSFGEWISVMFNVDLLKNVVGIVLGGLILYFITKKERKEKPIVNMPININKMVNNIRIVNNLEQIVNPLEKEGDKVNVVSVNNSKINTKINYKDKAIFKEAVKEMKNKMDIKISLEEFFGNLLDISLSRHKYGFLLEESSRVIPINFDKEPNIQELKKIFTERLKIKARATRKEGKIESLDIINYEIKKSKTLKNFMEVKQNKKFK